MYFLVTTSVIFSKGVEYSTSDTILNLEELSGFKKNESQPNEQSREVFLWF